MRQTSEQTRLSLGEFLQKIRGDIVPLSNQFSYFCAAFPLAEEDLRDYLRDPIAALPPKLCALLPKTAILLVPFLERAHGRSHAKWEDSVSFERPAAGKAIAGTHWMEGDEVIMAFGIEGVEIGDYHYEVFRQLASVAAWQVGPEQFEEYLSILREELNSRVHGEVDDSSWHAKQELIGKGSRIRRDSRGFSEYCRVSLADTLTLYLHGICCDIDVETGPRQLPSRHLRRRLKFLQANFPPPAGYAVFPEEVDALEGAAAKPLPAPDRGGASPTGPAS